MKPIPAQIGAALALTLALAACVPQPKSAPPVQSRPAPAPTPVPPPAYSSWLDVPATPGDWRYLAQPGGGIAAFGAGASEPRFTMRCDAASRTVILARVGQSNSAAQIVIRTETQTRSLAATPSRDGPPAIEARLAASDRLLDAMALSKGRFAIEVAGLPALYLPSWAEVTRVIEDCR